MNRDAAEKALEVAGFAVDIGQLDDAARRFLAAETRAGRVERIRAPYAGIMLTKTHYVAARDRFDRSQAASRAELTLAIALDEANRRQPQGACA